jgi:hypothetical protein
MEVNNILGKIISYSYLVEKENKQDTIFKSVSSNQLQSFFTEVVKIERFQGYSNAYNLGLYFRVKNESSWSKSKQITGLWKTTTSNIFYGDYLSSIGKSLLMFKICPKNESLIVYQFPEGYYPTKPTIDILSSKI